MSLVTARHIPNEWSIRLPTAGHPEVTNLTREAPTTQLAYRHPSDRTAHTAAGGAWTIRVTRMRPSLLLSCADQGGLMFPSSKDAYCP